MAHHSLKIKVEAFRKSYLLPRKWLDSFARFGFYFFFTAPRPYDTHKNMDPGLTFIDINGVHSRL